MSEIHMDITEAIKSGKTIERIADYLSVYYNVPYYWMVEQVEAVAEQILEV
jgi:hypothetical protein